MHLINIKTLILLKIIVNNSDFKISFCIYLTCKNKNPHLKKLKLDGNIIKVRQS